MSTPPEGIWAPYEAFYIEAMLSNTGSAMASLERVSDVIEEVERDRSGTTLDSIDTNGLIAELQNIVLQAAALSRYFWPARPGHEARAAHLRAALDVAESSPLRNRDLRNEIEHFDEKLDAYLAEGIAGYVVPAYVGPLPSNDGVPTHMFKAYYLDAGVFEIQRLHEVLLSFRQAGRLRIPV
jgi:hypothetical protein